MQPATIHDGGHQTPDRTPPVRMSRRPGAPRSAITGALLRAAIVGALAFAGWFLLSAPSGPQASADPRYGLGDTVRKLDRPVRNLDGPVRELDTIAKRTLGSDGPASRPAGHSRRSSPDTVTDLASTVSERGETRRLKVRELGRGGTFTEARRLLPKTPAADLLLSTFRLPDANTLLEAGLKASSGTEDASPSASAPQDGAGHAKPEPRLLRPGTQETDRCDGCTRHGPSVPRPDLPTSQDDLSGVFPQIGQGPGPLAGTLNSVIDTAPPVQGVRTLPATVLKDDSRAARPMVVPD